jgi:Secretion system C-terminal sorting domain
MSIITICLTAHSYCNAQSNNPYNQKPSEDDWSLPASVTKSNNAGIYFAYDIPDAYSLLVRWRDVNPAENVYNWAPFDAAVATGKPFFIRIWASDTLHCPRWVRKKHPTIPILHNQGGTNTDSYFDLFGTSPSDFFAIWHPGFDSEFKKFLLAFRAKNYLANPNVKFMYAPGAWRYNEWNLSEAVSEIIAKAPITPADFITWFKGHIDDYVNASNGYPHKMLFTGYGKIENPSLYSGQADWFFAANDTLQGNNVLTSYAVSKGMGVREGAQETFNSSSDMYAWGSPSITINNINYQTVDDNHPLHNDSLRITGTENEAFCDPNALIGGGVCSFYHIKMSTLKAMQLRVNWLNVRDSLIKYDPKLFQYFRLTANKTVKNSPDAWACLRQSYDPLFTATPPQQPEPVPNSPRWVDRITLPYRNWEKWLTQREVASDGKTVPVYQLNTNLLFDYYNFKAFEALRTDKASGSNYMYFAVDDAFMKGGVNPVQIKITYLDNFVGDWWLEYDAAPNNPFKKSTPITNANDNKWKTVTVYLNDAAFLNRQTQNMDFRIFNGGNSDITVRFVRLIKGVEVINAVEPEEDVKNEIKLYPNPTHDILYIETDLIFSEIIVRDMAGKQILKFNDNEKNINTSYLANGTYLILLKTKNNIYAKKFIKN